MPRYVFDLETNGLLDTLTCVHALVMKDLDSGFSFSCTDHPYRSDDPTIIHSDHNETWGIEDGLRLLQSAEEIIGHNIIRFDIPAIQKVYPWFTTKAKVTDTLVMARLIYPSDHLRAIDARLRKQGKIPGHLMGQHKLEAFGYRLGLQKGDYAAEMKARGLDPWAAWNPDMQRYCELDVAVTAALHAKLLSKDFSQRSIDLEHSVFRITNRQEDRGFLFDQADAAKLYARLVQRKDELEAALQTAFPPWNIEEIFVSKRNNKKKGWVAGVAVRKAKTIHFNPASRQHIARCLKTKYDWKPSEFTPTGEPKVDEAVLSQLAFPEAKVLAEYLMVQKRLGQIAEGKEAWLKKVNEKTGRIHGRVNSNGAQTGRMTHSAPNMAQVPSLRAPYGKECRALFKVPPGHLLVGCDADALELRCLAGYMARYDDGAYIKTVLEGSKDDGTDIHSVNTRALGLDPKKKYQIDGQNKSGRDIAKVWFYAFIYGAGDPKLGEILGHTGERAKLKGRESRRRFLKNLPALGRLTDDVKARVKKTATKTESGFLRGLDGRKLYVRSEHAALNTLLQGAGAIVMKEALVLCDAALQDTGLVPGEHYEFVANVHDEFQIEALEGHADAIGQIAKQSIARAGETLAFRCPLSGSYATGPDWAATH